MAGGWGCPHEVNDTCTKINDLPCNPGMKGCVLAGRYVFASEEKNQRLREKKERDETAADTPCK
jgi:orotidine-5'-phosphate decarboxylase